MRTEQILEQLTSQICVSGYESFSTMSQVLAGMMDSSLQVWGTNYVTKVGNGKRKILLTAHIDEVGFILTRRISPKNYGILSAGNVDPMKLDGQRLEFVDYRSKELVRSRPIKVSQNQLLADIEVSFEQDIGMLSVGSFQRQFDVDPEGLVSAPALDNRVGCTSLVQLFRELKSQKQSAISVYLAFVGREETGANGLIEVLRRIEPDIVIDIDSAYGKPVRMSEDRKNWMIPDIGLGPALQLIGKDFVLDYSLRKMVEGVSGACNIPLQYEVVDLQSGGTNARSIISNGYNPVQLNIPVSNQHSARSSASIKDIEAMSKLLLGIVNAVR